MTMVQILCMILLSFVVNRAAAFKFTGYLTPVGKRNCFRLMATKRQKKIAVPDDFVIPEPKPLTVTNGEYKNALTGTQALAWRLGSGVFVVGWQPVAPQPLGSDDWSGTLGVLRDGSSVLPQCRRPVKPIVIYDYEASPFCRKVREACSMLDLTVEYRPCPGAKEGWSDVMATMNPFNRRTVPYLEDSNSKKTVKMFESDEIIEYLFDTYGPGQDQIPFLLKGDLAVRTCINAAAARGFAGSKLRSDARNDITKIKPLTLWGYEGSPFVRPVRETLCSLGLRHILVYCARGSQNRDAMYRKTGRFQVPYLEDPNTGVNMFESTDIVRYLLQVYTS